MNHTRVKRVCTACGLTNRVRIIFGDATFRRGPPGTLRGSRAAVAVAATVFAGFFSTEVVLPLAATFSAVSGTGVVETVLAAFVRATAPVSAMTGACDSHVVSHESLPGVSCRSATVDACMLSTFAKIGCQFTSTVFAFTKLGTWEDPSTLYRNKRNIHPACYDLIGDDKETESPKVVCTRD